MLLKIASGLFPAVLDINSHVPIFIWLGSVGDVRTTSGGKPYRKAATRDGITLSDL